MPCVKCPGGYWVCDPDGDDGNLCTDRELLDPWRPKGTQTVAAGTQNVWCRPGCDATIAKQKPAEPPPWYDAGEIEFEAGTYELWCRSGTQDKCQVKIKKVP